VGPRTGLDGGKSRSTGIRSRDRPAPSSVAIPTELPGPRSQQYKAQIDVSPSHAYANWTEFQECAVLLIVTRRFKSNFD
jgi:hypothetical protein